MDLQRTWRDIRSTVHEAIADRRVTPPLPPLRTPIVADDESAAPAPRTRDASSSWSVFIRYENAKGEESQRRIDCKLLERHVGGKMTIRAFCHEKQQSKRFRLDRIQEAMDVVTGEFIDPYEHFEMLKLRGLPFTDSGMATFAKMLVFMSLCDGDAHAAEWIAIEEAIGRYALRFGGDDDDVGAAFQACRRIAPDGQDFLNCLGAVLRSPDDARKQVARLAIESCAAVVDADGRHAPEELHWGSAIGKVLKKLAV